MKNNSIWHLLKPTHINNSVKDENNEFKRVKSSYPCDA